MAKITGKVSQILGAVVDVEFSTDNQRATYVMEQMTQFVPNTTVRKEEGKND